MDIRWIENTRAAFVRIYGEKRGAAVCNAVIPGVLGDFRKMLLKAADGETVTETYRIDDLRADVFLAGHRAGGALYLTRLVVGGESVDLGGEALRI